MTPAQLTAHLYELFWSDIEALGFIVTPDKDSTLLNVIGNVTCSASVVTQQSASFAKLVTYSEHLYFTSRAIHRYSALR